MLLLIGLHLYLVRRHGVTPAAADAGKPTKKFYPEQMFKDSVATFGYVMVLVLFANFAKLGLGSLADPTDTRYIPRPEWYFLFLFQTLKLFQGPLEVLGAVILPNLGILALFLVPFFDRGRAIRRPPANRGDRADRIRRDRMGRLDGARRGDDRRRAWRIPTPGSGLRSRGAKCRRSSSRRSDISKRTTVRDAMCWGGRWRVRIWRKSPRRSRPTGSSRTSRSPLPIRPIPV